MNCFFARNFPETEHFFFPRPHPAERFSDIREEEIVSLRGKFCCKPAVSGV